MNRIQNLPRHCSIKQEIEPHSQGRWTVGRLVLNSPLTSSQKQSRNRNVAAGKKLRSSKHNPVSSRKGNQLEAP